MTVHEALAAAADTFRDLARGLRAIGHPTMAEACDLAEHHSRAALAGQQLELDERDLKIDVYRPAMPSSIDSRRPAVRITHLPTGLRAECSEHHSELRNRAQAMEELRRKVAAHEASDPGEPVLIESLADFKRVFGEHAELDDPRFWIERLRDPDFHLGAPDRELIAHLLERELKRV